MKKIINYLLICLFCAANIQAQSISLSVIASTGGYFNDGNGSLSFTVGESNTQSLATGDRLITQGFQQSYRLVINLKAYIQGYYQGGGSLANVLYNQGVVASPNSECDTVTIEFKRAMPPYETAFTTTKVLQTDGQLVCDGVTLGGQPYYLVLKHRNSIETWSAAPVTVDNNNVSYDFTVGANKAYGDNQTEVEPGVWAIYSGELVTDGNIDISDYAVWENDYNNLVYGYFASDLNGDGNVDVSDYSIFENNYGNLVSAVIP